LSGSTFAPNYLDFRTVEEFNSLRDRHGDFPKERKRDYSAEKRQLAKKRQLKHVYKDLNTYIHSSHSCLRSILS